MENVVDALKLAFAVFVFSMAMAVSFSVIGQARATSDTVLSLNDRTNNYDYVDRQDTNALEKDRIVGFETILPTIYRYAKEQYAVTILDSKENGYKPIVRYDLYTEGFMSDWNEVIKNENRSSDETSRFKEIKDRIEIVDNYLVEETGIQHIIWKSLLNGSGKGSFSAGTLYKGRNNNNSAINTVAPWMGNPNTDTIYRIYADIRGSEWGKNGVIYSGKNLSKYKNRKFKEKFIEIQTSGTTIVEIDEENNTEYSLETVKGNKKLEIIYILQ